MTVSSLRRNINLNKHAGAHPVYKANGYAPISEEVDDTFLRLRSHVPCVMSIEKIISALSCEYSHEKGERYLTRYKARRMSEAKETSPFEMVPLLR